MEELGIPERLHGTRDLEGDGRWTAFIARAIARAALCWRESPSIPAA